MLSAGTLLQSSPMLEDVHFHQAGLLIVQHDECGSIGFVVNKRFERTLYELAEYRHLPAFPLYDGGPVQKDKLYFIHRRPDLVQNGSLIAGALYLGGDFSTVTSGIMTGKLSGDDIKIFIGYCGWDPGQLEDEINEGSWAISNQPLEAAFSI